MAARKLQTEIDRTLKKVSEGVELFESIYEKMQATTNMTQKEKLETDLKTQIKKLQRLRDQIKTWVASNDIKDKSMLLENRKLIELQMEKFKACEKEMKTKAFSKEGLIQASKLDPKAQEKLEATQWLQSMVEDLLMQVEQAEAEIETLQGGVKKNKKGSAASERVDNLEHLNERRKWHISRLEIVLRLLDNGSLSSERVQELKEDVKYFVESNTEEEFEEDEGIYDELNLDEEEEKFGLVADEDESDSGSDDDSEGIPPRTPSKNKHDDESVTSKRDEQSPVLKKAAVTLQLRKSSIAEAKPPVPPPNPNFVAQPMASILKNGLPPAARPPAALPVRYAAAAAAAVTSPSPIASSTSTVMPSTAQALQTVQLSPKVSTVAAPATASSPSTALAQDLSSAVASSPSLTHPSVSAPSPMLSSTSGSALLVDGSTNSNNESPALSEAVSESVDVPQTSSPERKLSTTSLQSQTHSPVVAHGLSTEQTPFFAPQASTSSKVDGNQLQAQQGSGTPPLPQQLQHVPATPHTHTTSEASSLPPVPQQTQYATNMKLAISAEQFNLDQDAALRNSSPVVPMQGPQYPQQVPPRPSTNVSQFPGSLSDLVASFENVKQRAPHRMTNLDQVHKLLDSGYSNMPQPQDTEKPKYYVPRNPYHTPPFYPQTLNPVLSSPALFAQLDIETLFYVFYYLPGTYQQYLAAKELKRQSWRFHVKYLTWFQRHSEPQIITEEYEQGVYVYFDWEGSWCQRKKSDFRFEYRYLSED